MMGRARTGRVQTDGHTTSISGTYADYFRRNFHWQTDGYLSERSAAVYDAGVEFLFFGTADVMCRQVIAPISEFLKRDRIEARRARPGRSWTLASGTGRTLLQPRGRAPGRALHRARLEPVLHEARGASAHGRSRRLLGDRERGEAFFRDAEFDVATSTFLFHELPERARRNVLAEMKRTLRPGGLLVLEDAAQLVEVPRAARLPRELLRSG